ncbi:hypothetical protein CHUAL_004975 [Chamberlinius hualienensis]
MIFWWTVVFLFVLYLLQRLIRYLLFVNSLPGPKGSFLLGNAWRFLVPSEDIMKIFQDSIVEFQDKPFVCFWILNKTYIFVFSPEAVQVILNSTVNIRKSSIYNLTNHWLGDGLLTSNGRKWHEHRKLLTPSFHLEILNSFVPSFNYHSSILTDKLKDKCDNGLFDVVPYIALCALDIICETTMGTRLNAQLNSNTDYVKAIDKLGHLLLYRSARPWLHFDWLYKLTPAGRLQQNCLNVVRKFTNNIINERMKTRKLCIRNSVFNTVEQVNGKRPKLALLDKLLDLMEQEPTAFSHKEIREQVDTFVFEGHDTTATCITWTLFLLGHHISIQHKVHKELDEIFVDDINRDIVSSDFPKMKYLKAVIEESLRIFSPVALFGRTLDHEIQLSKTLYKLFLFYNLSLMYLSF